MKVKYTGDQPLGCVDFVLAGVVPDGTALEPGKIYDVPETDKMFIHMIMATPLFELQQETKKKKGDK